MRTILSGSLAYDRIMDFPELFSDHLLPDKLDEINVSFMVNGLTENFGGTAGNIAFALKLMGGEPEISATIGLDNHRYFDWLKQNGISTDHILIVEDEWTAGAYITTDRNSNQITGFNPGAMKFSSNLNFENLDNDTLLIVSPGNLEDMVEYPRKCRERNIRYIFDPGQALPMLQGDDLLACIDGCMLLMVNDYELNLILKKTSLPKEEILERAGTSVITMGHEGSLLYTGTSSIRIPIIPGRKVADPTGAGDAYRGGLLSGIVQQKSLEECCIIGSVCASFAVEHHGTQVYFFSDEEYGIRRNLLPGSTRSHSSR
jgi:adenosine kinase